MAQNTDFVYAAARQMAAAAGLGWVAAPVNMMLVSASYAPNSLTDQFVSVIPAGAILLRDIALSSLGVTAAGVCFGTIPPLNAELFVPQVRGMVLYYKQGSDAGSQLIYYTSTGPGFPFQAQGFNYAIAYDQLAGGYFTA